MTCQLYQLHHDVKVFQQKLKKYQQQGNLEEDETMDVDLRGDEDDDDMDLGMIERLDHSIHWYHQDVWNEFASQETCMEVGSKGNRVFRDVWWDQD